MKTVEDIIPAINNYRMVVLENPKGYASDPRALEHVLMVLESVEEYTLNDDQERLQAPNAYAAYLENRGFGNAMFTTRRYPERELTDKYLKVFNELSMFWKDYFSGK
jgi:hypothetical protein